MSLHPTTPTLTDGVDPQHWVRELVQLGAVIHEPGHTPCLVGELRWLCEGTVGWFPAFGDRADDARVLAFDNLSLEGNQALFTAHGVPVAELTAVRDARVVDPEDYEIGWRLWLEVLPLRRALLEAAFERLWRSTPGAAACSTPPFG